MTQNNYMLVDILITKVWAYNQLAAVFYNNCQD